MRWVLRGVVLVVTVAWSCGEASQWLLRSRTHRLLHDLNELHLGEESSAHFQEFQTKWSRWGLKSDFTPSTAGDYSFRVQITSGFAPHQGAVPQKLRDLLWLMRLWPNGVIAHVNIHDGKAASKNLMVVVNTWDSDMEVATVESEKIADDPPESHLLAHPNHDVQCSREASSERA